MSEVRRGVSAWFSVGSDCRVLLVDQPPIPEGEHPSTNQFAGRIVELARVPRMEADVLVARLRAEGLRASSYGSDTVYGSVTFPGRARPCY